MMTCLHNTAPALSAYGERGRLFYDVSAASVIPVQAPHRLRVYNAAQINIQPCATAAAPRAQGVVNTRPDPQAELTLCPIQRTLCQFHTYCRCTGGIGS